MVPRYHNIVGPVPKYCGPIAQIYLTKNVKNELSFKRSNCQMSVHVSKSTKYKHRAFFLVSVTLSVSLTHRVLSPAIPTTQRNRPGGRRRLAREEDGPRRDASTPSTTSGRRAGGGQRAGRAGAAMEPAGRAPPWSRPGDHRHLVSRHRQFQLAAAVQAGLRRHKSRLACDEKPWRWSYMSCSPALRSHAGIASMGGRTCYHGRRGLLPWRGGGATMGGKTCYHGAAAVRPCAARLATMARRCGGATMWAAALLQTEEAKLAEVRGVLQRWTVLLLHRRRLAGVFRGRPWPTEDLCPACREGMCCAGERILHLLVSPATPATTFSGDIRDRVHRRRTGLGSPAMPETEFSGQWPWGGATPAQGGDPGLCGSMCVRRAVSLFSF
jgi:hypothetical protein